jgi:squalene synthase HpnC
MTTTVAEAPNYGAVMAQAQDENFPVALRLLGRREKQALMAIYGVARLIDDIGDEAAGDRGALLDWVDAELDRVYAGEPPEHPLMQALAHDVRTFHLPETAFRRLVEANRMDQSVTRYKTFNDLLHYCQLSAAPVGELVLHVFDAATPERIALSDRVCAGLQVTEHIQDVREDYARGRVYIAQEDLVLSGCSERELAGPKATPAAKSVIAFEVARADALLDMGAPLAKLLPLRPRLAVAAFVAGGRAALDAIFKRGYDVWREPPRRSRSGFVRRLPGALLGR